MRSLRTLLSSSLAILVTAAPALAAASPPFPEAIRADLKLPYSLGTSACLTKVTSDCHCTICHQTNSGGANTVTRPFGKAMKTAGLGQEDTASLQTALTALQTAGTDSDCNGVPDIEQLVAGLDPNTGLNIDGNPQTTMPSTGCGEVVAFGCGAQLAASPASWQGGLALAAALAAAVARARSRSRAR